ncbi:hypothetical protein GCM10023162_03210 [Klenkia terrae]
MRRAPGTVPAQSGPATVQTAGFAEAGHTEVERSGLDLIGGRDAVGRSSAYPGGVSRFSGGGVMRARLLWTLLLLAAVFSMHGLSCAAADSAMTGTSTHTSTATVHSPTAAAGSVVGLVVAGAAMSDMDAAHSTDQTGGHSSAAHALMVCLAVLAGGVGAVLAALAVWLSRRRLGTVYTRAAGHVRVVVDRAAACAPTPELSRLCVLRV